MKVVKIDFGNYLNVKQDVQFYFIILSIEKYELIRQSLGLCIFAAACKLFKGLTIK